MLRYARFRLDLDLLRRYVPLPASATILGSSECYGHIEIIVTDPAFAVLPVPALGEELPLVEPTFTTTEQLVSFESWNLPPSHGQNQNR